MLFSLRITEDKKFVSVNDVIRGLTKSREKTIQKNFERLDESLKSACPLITFDSDQKPTRAASIDVITQIIREIGCKATKKKRQECIEFLTKIFAGESLCEESKKEENIPLQVNEKENKDKKTEMEDCPELVQCVPNESCDKKTELKEVVQTQEKKSIAKELEVTEEEGARKMLQKKRLRVEEESIEMQRELYFYQFDLQKKTLAQYHQQMQENQDIRSHMERRLQKMQMRLDMELMLLQNYVAKTKLLEELNQLSVVRQDESLINIFKQNVMQGVQFQGKKQEDNITQDVEDLAKDIISIESPCGKFVAKRFEEDFQQTPKKIFSKSNGRDILVNEYSKQFEGWLTKVVAEYFEKRDK
jgi:hypothetical protein